MATDKLNIDQFKENFKHSKSFSTIDIIQFYRTIDPQIKSSTINWRIYSLIQIGVLTRIGRGWFAVGTGKIYSPILTSKLKSIYSKIKKEYPYLKLCLWSSSACNEFMIHQQGRFYILVEVEKVATKSVFYFLKEAKFSVFVEPTKDLIEKYIPNEEETIIVKPLVTEAPLKKIGEINTVSLEKMLVDIFCDEVIFSAQQGSEMRTIFKEAKSKYSVNKNTILRYANRRRRKESFIKYWDSIR